MSERPTPSAPTTTLATALEQAARTDNGIFFQQEDGRVSFKSYAALELDAARIARALRERLPEGERVGIVLADPEAFLGVLFGAALGGMVPVLLSPPASLGSAVAQLCRQIEIARPGLVVTTHGLLPVISGAIAPGAIATTDELSGGEPLRERADARAVVLAAAEGGRLASAREIAATAEALGGKQGMALTSQDVVATLLPLSQPVGLLATILAPLSRGASVLLLHPLAFLRAPVEAMRMLSIYRAGACFLPASAMGQIARRVAAPELAGIRLSSLRLLGHGGGAEVSVVGALRDLLAAAGLSEKALVAGGRAAKLCDELVAQATPLLPPAPPRASAPAGSPRMRLSGSLFATPAARQVNGPGGLRAAIGRALGL